MTIANSRRRATISDVARLAGVSISTVSRVLNDTAPVAGDTMVQVRQAMRLLDYTPHAAARTLAGRRIATIGLLLPQIAGAFFYPLIQGIELAARESGFDLLIHASSQTPAHLEYSSMPLGQHNTDGLMVFTNRLSDADLARLYRRDFPLVLLHRTPPAGLSIPCVTFENKAGSRRAVEHLIEVHGCRRIAFIAGPAGNEDSYWREMGYREALNAHGLPFDPALAGIGDFEGLQARQVVEEWLMQGIEIDAIFAGDDEMATGAMFAMRGAGKRVPEDVAIIGFDDVPFVDLLSPPLTTVRAPIEEAGSAAARQLISVVRTGMGEPLTLLPTELVVRKSCGC
ncbi:MAG: LacI family DNA-binding transcriptional regulator [Chloroflexota bacterium]|nr:LacI family DNA-binding transcriptional regulator [Chloroflexota bacterium]